MRNHVTKQAKTPSARGNRLAIQIGGYLAIRSLDSYAPMVSKADMICVEDVTMKKFELPLAQYLGMVERQGHRRY